MSVGYNVEQDKLDQNKLDDLDRHRVYEAGELGEPLPDDDYDDDDLSGNNIKPSMVSINLDLDFIKRNPKQAAQQAKDQYEKLLVEENDSFSNQKRSADLQVIINGAAYLSAVIGGYVLSPQGLIISNNVVVEAYSHRSLWKEFNKDGELIVKTSPPLEYDKTNSFVVCWWNIQETGDKCYPVAWNNTSDQSKDKFKPLVALDCETIDKFCDKLSIEITKKRKENQPAPNRSVKVDFINSMSLGGLFVMAESAYIVLRVQVAEKNQSYVSIPKCVIHKINLINYV